MIHPTEQKNKRNTENEVIQQRSQMRENQEKNKSRFKTDRHAPDIENSGTV